MKKIMIGILAISFLIAAGAIILPSLTSKDKEDTMAPLPDNPQQDAIVGQWQTKDDSANNISLDIKGDGKVTGTVDGQNFKGTWGFSKQYIIYNSNKKATFTGTISDGVLSLKSPDFVSSASKWKLYKK